MNQSGLELVQEYGTALGSYLVAAREAGLERAYELGRLAISRGLGVLDLASVHQAALAELLRAKDASPDACAFLPAMAFFTESLSTFEMLHRGVRETNARLKELNQELEEKNRRLREAEEALHTANESLELRVAQRTEELTRVNSALKTEADERRLLEEQLRHSQRMDAVGQLAGGVAHDFNNLLTIVLSYTQLLMGDSRAPASFREDLQEIRRAGERAADLTRQLLAFSRKQVLEPRPLNLNEVIGQMDKMLRRLIGEDITLVTRPFPGLQMASADPGQVEQVLLNLVVNARDAMPRGGQLTVETANVTLDDTYARTHLGVTPGPHVMLAVSDTGLGMDKATQARIFEPFFTTKTAGKGTGLGLSTVFGIVKQSGGSIWLYSEVGHGTTFKVYLPSTRPERAAEAVTAEPEASTTGSETILLAEDEEQVRRLVSTVLRRNGYTVLEARNGAEGLSVCESHPGPIHLLLTDVVMPEVGGRSLAERLAAARPEMKTLYMSGYTDDAVVRHGVLSATVAFLQKPVTPEALLKKVRAVLSASTAPQ